MRTETQTVRIGEWLGPVDWSFDFAENAPNYATSPENAAKLVAERVDRLREVEAGLARGEQWEIYEHGMWHVVTRVGMYDGWPYWKPYPTYGYRTWMGEDRTSWSGPVSAARKPQKTQKGGQE